MRIKFNKKAAFCVIAVALVSISILFIIKKIKEPEMQEKTETTKVRVKALEEAEEQAILAQQEVIKKREAKDLDEEEEKAILAQQAAIKTEEEAIFPGQETEKEAILAQQLEIKGEAKEEKAILVSQEAAESKKIIKKIKKPFQKTTLNKEIEEIVPEEKIKTSLLEEPEESAINA